MNYLSDLASSLDFPELSGALGRAAGVLLEPLPGSGERYCVAVVVRMKDGEVGAAVTVNPKLAKSVVGTELTSSLFNFGQMAAVDFQLKQGQEKSNKWLPPFNGMFVTEWREFQGENLQDIISQASMIFATFAHTGEEIADALESQLRPSAAVEDLFRHGVRQKVAGRKPGLDQYFEQEVSATGSGQARFKIDYLSPTTAACFTAINPAAPHRYLLSRAQSALWKIATVRDAVPIFRPSVSKLIAWLPEPGLPIYTQKHYDIAKEVEEELRYEATRFGIDVVAQFRDDQAAEYLVGLEQTLNVH